MIHSIRGRWGINSAGAFRCVVLSIVSIWLLCATAQAMDPMFVKTFPAQGSLQIVLHDDIDSPLYSWPRTLLTYPVDFSRRSCKAAELVLTQEEGKAVPFQLSDVRTARDGTLVFAKVSFFSALEPGATHTFELKVAAAPQQDRAGGVRSTRSGNTWVVDSGLLKVKLPDTQEIAPGAEPPGPLLGVDRGQGWIGGSKLLSGDLKVQRLKTAVIESGELFQVYRVTYEFEGGARYEATLKMVYGYPFVELTERMSGLTPESNVAVEMDWNGLHPARRFAANGWQQPPEGLGIDEPVMTPGIIEEPHWFPADRVEDPSKEMIFHLAAYQGNAPRDAVPEISFWEAGENGQELSVFVPDAKGWDDGQYMVWQPTTRLQVSFRYANGHLIWHWPLVNGTRTTDIALTSVKDGDTVVGDVRQRYQQAARSFRGAFTRNTNFPGTLNQRYGQWLRSWYGGLNLNKVKDWVLTYPASLKPPPPAYLPISGRGSGTAIPGVRPEDLVAFVYASPLMTYPLGLNLGVLGISHRVIRPIVERYMQLRSQMTDAQRRKLDAILLLSAYVNAGEDMAPVRVCLSGTPNISADGFSVPAELAVLYPQHPMTAEWADQFEKTIQLQAKFYTRPDVPEYGSLGGRWTESLSIYNWAYFAPTLAAQVSLSNTDGKNRLANAEMAERGRWMVDELSAPIWNPNPIWRLGQAPPPTGSSPWKPGIELSSRNGFERQYPPHGAHGSGTGIIVPKDVPIIAHALRNYDPLVAEHLLWAYASRTSTRQSEGDEPYWQAATLKLEQGNSGTNPHLKSVKYTGHGIILRAGVDTPEELSVHLDQTDQGPNYRWGNNGEGSSGILYFFASGQPWTGHEQENTGDHSNDDATGTTTFAVLHDHAWRSIGENVLDQPMYDLGLAQFAEIDARHDHVPYSWPAYRSRSVMLVGTDYMILGDDAQGETRFTWFTAKDLPFPKIVFLTPLTSRPDHWTQVTTRMSKGFLRDAIGPSVVLVTHKKQEVEMEKMHSTPLAFPDLAGLSLYRWDKAEGPSRTDGVYFVRTASSHDRVFRSFKPIEYQDGDEAFQGTAGVIRSRTDGSTEMALFHGTVIAAGHVRLQVPAGAEVGISARVDHSGNLSGIYASDAAVRISVQVPPAAPASLVCYIEGRRAEQSRQGNVIAFTLEPGRHAWELTSRPPMPMSPSIVRTVNGNGSARVVFNDVAAADHYRLEVSTDQAATWKPAGEGKSSPLVVHGLSNGTKVHVRVVAVSADGREAPGPEYPIYVTNAPPPVPDGLALELAPGTVHASWGEVLGASEYRLYRRRRGESPWTLVCHGSDRSCVDHAEGVTEPAYMPGRADNALRDDTAPVYDYAVTAVNDNGESARSFTVSTDPAGWLAWWPRGAGREFKRQTGYWLPPYVPAAATPPMFYPAAAK
jgi:hypothetical protein